ncbi:hypothetical protein K503DRAFT_857552 [Rhizopogon vinicolor AM-OR11-026]|uniref:DRBM domain-containing protein n=1 Tax=Rhizopogon vinicolor AM-OR11-026 TaxID=1314800 RepID=A0A1B7MWY6_9AGAM|nr:hypothetical protein K503DRAFT_857552 [Rhizopogon vinicolor AM-OR11-026]
MSQHTHPRTALNNALQSMYGGAVGNHVRWETQQTGTPHSQIWHTKIYIDDMNYGHGSATTKGASQEEAARQAYDKLRREGWSRS